MKFASLLRMKWLVFIQQIFFFFVMIMNSCFAVQNDTITRDSAEVIIPEMVFVQGGFFAMGSTGYSMDERPVHNVLVTDFYIGKYEVTQKQWAELMDRDHDNYHAGCEDCPVERVSWYNIQEYIEKLNERTGLHFRLPTEAEWEYAARGGLLTRGFKYSGSNHVTSVSWKDGNSSQTSHPVGLKWPNELGIYDMTGNVWEFCSDFYDPGYYRASPSENPAGPLEGTERVMRGGSWFFDSNGLRNTDRDKANPTFRYGYIGFRLCRSAH